MLKMSRLSFSKSRTLSWKWKSTGGLSLIFRRPSTTAVSLGTTASSEFYQLRHTSITGWRRTERATGCHEESCRAHGRENGEYYTSIRDNQKVQAVKDIESASPQLLVLLGIEADPDAKIQ